MRINVYPSFAARGIMPLLMVALFALCRPSLAAPSQIDPEPSSPTLGEILDLERKAANKTPERPNAPAIEAKPNIPSGATTVLTPGARLGPRAELGPPRAVRIIPITRQQ